MPRSSSEPEQGSNATLSFKGLWSLIKHVLVALTLVSLDPRSRQTGPGALERVQALPWSDVQYDHLRRSVPGSSERGRGGEALTALSDSHVAGALSAAAFSSKVAVSATLILKHEPSRPTYPFYTAFYIYGR